jgi:hypothetical protein
VKRPIDYRLAKGCGQNAGLYFLPGQFRERVP